LQFAGKLPVLINIINLSMKKHNFSAGPSVLARTVIEKTAEAVLDFNGTGLSVLEVSHRGKDFMAVMDETVELFREVLNVPEGYEILFLHGGASLNFCMIPYNLLQKKAAYLETGTWAKKAIKEAKYFGQVDIVASSKDKNFSYIPRNYEIPSDADYFHITTNNTIFGTQIHEDIESPVPLVADMSSDICSRPIDVSRYGLIYGGAQKNLGPAGAGFVVIRKDILGKVERDIPSMLDYRIHIENCSMFNTPPCLPVFTIMETLKWIRDLGGLEKMQEVNIRKAAMLYDVIDNSRVFLGTAEKESRSLMNVCFVMREEFADLEAEFLTFAQSKGMIGIKGHRSVGGFRASVYNALPVESVQALIDVMSEFEEKKRKSVMQNNTIQK
jgi:phosphoserine aminotransferase